MGMKNGNAMLLVSKVKFKLFVLELRQFRLSRVVLVAFIVSIPQFGLGILKELKKYHR
jgi:hypothetical protein